MTNHRAPQRSVAWAIIASVLLLAVTLSTASAASLTLGYGGDGIFPREATANSQRWFRVRVMWDASTVTDGTYGTFVREVPTRLRLLGPNYNDTVEVLPGVTYADAHSDLRNFLPGGTYAGNANQFGVHVLQHTTSSYTLTIGPFSTWYYQLLVGELPRTASTSFQLRYNLYSTTDHGYNAVTSDTPVAHVTTRVVVGGGNPGV